MALCSVSMFLCLVYSVKGSINPTFQISGEIVPIYNGTTNSSTDNLRSIPLFPGEEITFQFAFHLVKADAISSIQFVVNGTRLKFSTKSASKSTLQVFAEFEHMNSSFIKGLSKSGTIPKLNTTTKINSDLKSAIIVVDNKGFPVKLIQGEFRMVVSKTLTEGTIRSYMYATCWSMSDLKPFSLMVYSPPFSMPVTNIDIGRCEPDHLSLRQMTNLHINVSMPSGTLAKSYIVLYLPVSKDKEAKMTIRNLYVEDTQGIDEKDAEILVKTPYFRQSPTLTSECNIAHLLFPRISTRRKAKIVVKAESLMQDFIGFKDNTILEINVGFKVNEDSIWIGKTHVIVKDIEHSNATKEAKLQTSLSEIQRYVHEDSMLSKLRLTIAHSQNSMATVYNVSVILYISPSLTFVKATRKFVDVVKPYNVVEDVYGTVRVEIPRISFSHTSKFIFNLTTYGLRDKFEKGQQPLVVYEVIYNVWRDPLALDLGLQYLQITIPAFPKSDWNVTLTCTCPFNPTLKNCACCKPGDCFCGENFPDKCNACDERWRCFPILPEYFKQSILVDEKNNTVLCDNRENRRIGMPFISCSVISPNGKTYHFPTIVAIILGMDLQTGIMYGVGNTGLGYVRSADNGSSWQSIARQFFIRATNSTSFRNATLI